MYFDVAYAPFGEIYATSGTTDPAFTGQRQDTVAGLFDFPAREYSTQGRWPHPDPSGLASVSLSDPQTLNRFAYVRNNPLALVDPNGLCIDVYNGPTGLGSGSEGPFCDMSDSDAFQHSGGGGGGRGGGGTITVPVVPDCLTDPTGCGDPTTGGAPGNGGSDCPANSSTCGAAGQVQVFFRALRTLIATSFFKRTRLPSHEGSLQPRLPRTPFVTRTGTCDIAGS